MPGSEHDGLIEFFRRDPLLAADLARACGLQVPPHDDVRVASGEVGAAVSAYRCDVLLVFSVGGRPVFAIIIEIQRVPDDDKAVAWPLYAASAAARLRCPVLLIVYATNARTARWARHELVLTRLAGRPCHPDDRPIVIAPADVPAADLDEAMRRPYLAAFTASARANGAGGFDAVRVALEAVEQLPVDAGVTVRDTTLASLNRAMRATVLEYLDMQNYVLKSEIMRKWRADAIEEGREEGLRAMLRSVLHARALGLDDTTEALLAGCHDAAQLERWGVRAVTATCIEDVFAE